MILYLDRFIQKILREYRKAVFRAKTHCKHKNFVIRGHMTLINPNITIGKNVTFYPDVMLFGDGPITIGDNVSIGNGTIIASLSKEGITIGNNTMIAAQSYIIDCDHGMQPDKPIREQKHTTEPITIGEDVWLAANVTVLKGSQIGNGAVIGAKGLVKGKIPPYAIAVGVPAKVIKYREDIPAE